MKGVTALYLTMLPLDQCIAAVLPMNGGWTFAGRLNDPGVHPYPTPLHLLPARLTKQCTCCCWVRKRPSRQILDCPFLASVLVFLGHAIVTP